MPTSVKTYFKNNGQIDTFSKVYDNRVLVLEDIEKEEVSSSAATMAAETAAVNHPSTSSEISISELYELVNSEYAKDLPQKTADTGFLPNEYATGISHAFTRRLDRLGKALGVSYVYDGSLGDGVNGMKQGNVIRLNPNVSVNDGWIVGHETGHVMKTRATAEWGDSPGN